MIHLYTGEGKGKTTAALGQAIRAAGNGFHVIFAQFMKGNETGELQGLAHLENVQIIRSRKHFGFYHTLNDAQKEELTNIHNEILDILLREAGSEKVFLIVLDEITYPVKWGLLDEEKLKHLLFYAGEGIHMGLEIVLTGRDPADFLSECADYITEMKCIRHPFERGIGARKGIEY